jgi:hypothetical protein
VNVEFRRMGTRMVSSIPWCVPVQFLAGLTCALSQTLYHHPPDHFSRNKHGLLTSPQPGPTPVPPQLLTALAPGLLTVTLLFSPYGQTVGQSSGHRALMSCFCASRFNPLVISDSCRLTGDITHKRTRSVRGSSPC